MKVRYVVLFLAAGILIGGGEVIADPGSYPSQEVLRPLTLTEGMFESEFNVHFENIERVFDEDGTSGSAGFDRSHWGTIFDLRYGVSDNMMVDISVPYNGVHLEADGAPSITQDGLGDISLTGIYQVFGRTEPLRSLALIMGFHFPTGDDIWEDGKLTGLGFFSLSPALAYKHVVSDFALSVGGGYTAVLPRVKDVQYITNGMTIEVVDLKRFDVDIGDFFHVSGSATYQATDQFAARLGMHYLYKNADARTDSAGFMENIPNSSRQALRIFPVVLFHVNEYLDIFMRNDFVAFGENIFYGYLNLTCGVEGRF